MVAHLLTDCIYSSQMCAHLGPLTIHASRYTDSSLAARSIFQPGLFSGISHCFFSSPVVLFLSWSQILWLLIDAGCCRSGGGCSLTTAACVGHQNVLLLLLLDLQITIITTSHCYSITVPVMATTSTKDLC